MLCGTIALILTTFFAGSGHPIAIPRNTIAVAIVCFAAGGAGEALIHLRRRERDIAIRASRRERTLQIMFQESPAVTLLLDRGGRIVAANGAALRPFATDSATFVGSSIAQHIPDVEGVKPEGYVHASIEGRDRTPGLSSAELENRAATIPDPPCARRYGNH